MRIEDRPKKRMGVGKKMAYIITACVFMATMAILAIVKTTTEAEAMEAKIYESLQIQREDVPEPAELVCIDNSDLLIEKLTDDDRLLIAKVVQAEAGTEPFVGKVAVASTILNRAEMREMSIHDVVYEKNQYASPWVGTIENEVMDAVDFAYENRDLFPRNMFFFRTNHFHRLAFTDDYCQIGAHYFSTDNRY